MEEHCDPTDPGKQPKNGEDAPPKAVLQPSMPPAAPEGIDQLMPALLEINIRQARAGGQADLAQALQSLQRKLQVLALRIEE